MKLKDAVETMLQTREKNKSWLSEKLGYSRATALSNILTRGNVRLENLVKICDALDYEVVIQPSRKHKKGPRPKDQILLEVEEE